MNGVSYDSVRHLINVAPVVIKAYFLPICDVSSVKY